jgi:hypothetical protein
VSTSTGRGVPGQQPQCLVAAAQMGLLARGTGQERQLVPQQDVLHGQVPVTAD